MNEYQIRQFAKVAETCNISKATTELNLTQQAISHTIGVLEKELGVDLFVRKPRGLELTRAGERIYPVAQLLLSKYDNLMQIIEQIAEEERRKFSICFEHVFVSFVIPPEFYTSIAGLTAHMEYTSGFSECLELLRSGKADLAVVHKREIDDSFIYSPIVCEPPVIVMSEDNPLAQMEYVTIDDLRFSNFVMPAAKSPLLDKFIEKCIDCGFYPKTVFESSDLEMLKRTVAQNLGVLLSASFGLGAEDVGLLWRPLVEEGLLQEIGFLQYEDAKMNRYAESFIKAIQAMYE